MWSRQLPETTLPSSYSARAKFSLISLQNSAARLHEVTNSSRVGEITRGKGGELSHLGRQGNPSRRDNFFSSKHLVSPTRDGTTRTKMRAHAITRVRSYYSYSFPVVRHSVEYLTEQGLADVKFHTDAPQSCLEGRVVSGTRDHINGALFMWQKREHHNNLLDF